MFQAILSFLGHDGIRVLIFLFVIVGNMVKSQATAAKKREDKLRGSTAIRDFSTPGAAPAATPSLSPGSSATAKPVAPKPAPPKSVAPPTGASARPLAPPKSPISARKSSDSSQGSPWSSNQDPFK